MKYDLHIHSCLSPCGDVDMTPNNIAGMAMLGGIELVALTDHNTTLNCPAFFKACEKLGIIPVGGMELTTAEDIHMVCLFPNLETTMAFGEMVAEHRMKIKNRPDIFGDQTVLDENDEIVSCIDDLLVAGTDLDISTAYDLVMEYGGAAFPAHVDKQSNGILAILGDFPIEPIFATAEFHDISKREEYIENYPALANMNCITCSDAHYLHLMSEAPDDLPIERKDMSDEDVRKAVIKYLNGHLTKDNGNI